jgi:hypothetical protein
MNLTSTKPDFGLPGLVQQTVQIVASHHLTLLVRHHCSYLGSASSARQTSQEMLLPGNATDLKGQSDAIHVLMAV